MLQVIQKQQAGNSSQGCAELSVNDSPDQMKARKRREIGEDDLGSTGDIDQDLGKTKCRKEHPEDISSGETAYICIPRFEMIQNEQIILEPPRDIISDYKLIDGLPGTGTDSVVMKRKSYVMSFNRDTMNANWVYEILNRNIVPENHVERAKFVDPYQRGHLAAAANQKWCCEALDDANMIDNIVPQHRDLNTGPWKSLEEYCRRTARDPNIRNVHVYSGPLYLDENPRVKQGKRVPSHFFKVIIEENEIGTVKLRCHQAPNGNLPLENLNTNTNTTIENIQQNSGLTFIQNRPNTGQNAAAHEIRVTLHGEDENAVPRTAEIQVTTSPFV